MKKVTFLVFCAILFAVSTSYSLTISDTQIENISSQVALVYGYDQSTINIDTGADVSHLKGYDFSTFNVNGGEISWLTLYENNTTNINFVDSLSWLLVNDSSVVNIFGSNFSYSGGHLSGVWGNGVAFSFWAFEEADLLSGNFSGAMPDNIILHAAPVPEPSTFILIVAGLLSIYIVKGKSNKLTRWN